MTKKGCLLLLLTLSLFLFGCWDKSEVDSLAIVSAIGVDQIQVEGKDKWQITLEIYRTTALVSGSEDGGGTGEVNITWVASSIGDTIQEAIDDLATRSPRVLFFPHASLIFIGKETAEQVDLGEILALFLGSNKIRLRSNVVISNKSALEAMTSSWELEQSLSAEIKGMIEENRLKISKGVKTDLKEIGDALTSPGKDVIIGKVETFPIPESASQEADEAETTENHSLRYHGSAVFSQERLAGWLTDIETRGFLFVTGAGGISTISLTEDTAASSKTNENSDRTSVRLIKSKSKIKVNLNKGKPEIQLKINVTGQIEELHREPFKEVNKLLEETGKRMSQEIKKEIMLSINQAKTYQADIFGFGQAIYRKYPKLWQELEHNWRNYFVELPIQVEVETKIRGTGIFDKPVNSL